MEFHYRFWAACNVGSTVTFEGGAGFMTVRATLEERGDDRVVLRILCRARGSADMDFLETLRPSRTPAGCFFPVTLENRDFREGNEVIEVAGQEWLSRWIESSARYLDREVMVKAWIVDQVPGGIARWQMLERPREPNPLTWTVKAFVRK